MRTGPQKEKEEVQVWQKLLLPMMMGILQTAQREAKRRERRKQVLVALPFSLDLRETLCSCCFGSAPSSEAVPRSLVEPQKTRMTMKTTRTGKVKIQRSVQRGLQMALIQLGQGGRKKVEEDQRWKTKTKMMMMMKKKKKKKNHNPSRGMKKEGRRMAQKKVEEPQKERKRLPTVLLMASQAGKKEVHRGAALHTSPWMEEVHQGTKQGEELLLQLRDSRHIDFPALSLLGLLLPLSLLGAGT